MPGHILGIWIPLFGCEWPCDLSAEWYQSSPCRSEDSCTGRCHREASRVGYVLGLWWTTCYTWSIGEVAEGPTWGCHSCSGHHLASEWKKLTVINTRFVNHFETKRTACHSNNYVSEPKLHVEYLSQQEINIQLSIILPYEELQFKTTKHRTSKNYIINVRTKNLYELKFTSLLVLLPVKETLHKVSHFKVNMKIRLSKP